MYNYRKMLGPHERVYYFGSVHWITMVNSLFFCLVLAFAAFSMIDFMNEGGLFIGPVNEAGSDIAAVTGEATNHLVYWFYDIVRYIPWLMIAFGVMWVIKDTIRYICTKVLLTSHRMVVKKGFLMVRMHEIELDEIEAANVNQLTLGRVFGYGTIHLDARLVDDYDLPVMNKPYKFVKVLHILKDYDISGEEQEETELDMNVVQDKSMPQDAEQIAKEAQESDGKTPYHKPTLRKRNSGADVPRKRKRVSQEDLDFLRKNQHT